MNELSIVTVSLIATNNRATEAFKAFLKQRNVSDELRRFGTLLFSILFGMLSVGVMVYSGMIESIPELEALADYPVAIVIVGGVFTSLGGAFTKDILKLVSGVGNLAKPRNQGDGQTKA
jgi:hypothetical protein